MTNKHSIPPGAVQFVPTVERVLYGAGMATAQVESEAHRLGAQRAMMLTHTSLENGGLIKAIEAALGARLAGHFAAGMQHAPFEAMARAAQAARDARADLVIAVGGGGAVDVGKGARLCLAAGITSAQDLDAFMQKPTPVSGAFIPQLNIPTTLSGAEYSRSFSATDLERGVKRAYTNTLVAGKSVIYDPEATVDTPEGLWFASGVMAVDHAVEVYVTSPAHLVGDALKLHALWELITYLPRTRINPHDLDARLRCQVAAWLADHSPLRSQPISPVPAALPSHSLAYELAALCNVGYGWAACVTLAPCLRWMAERWPECRARQRDLAVAAHIAIEDSSPEEGAKALADRLEGFIRLLSLPTKLRDVGVTRKDIGRIARSFAERKARLTPEAPATENDVARLLEENW
jgi:alcohol dehydrogenase